MTETKSKIGVIVPTVREVSINRFLRLWEKDFSIAKQIISIYVIEDNPEPSFNLGRKIPFEVRHVAWDAIKRTLGKDSWIIPRKSDAIRSFGVLLAYRDGCDYFITMDDDAYPWYQAENKIGYFIDSHILNLTGYHHEEDVWINTIRNLRPRGYPYAKTTVTQVLTNVAVSHGLWVNVPDFDSITSLSLSKKDHYYDHIQNMIIPPGKFFPMCGMNLAWKRSVAPLMYFLLMGQDENGKKFAYERFGDMWCGIFLKKIIDHLGWLAVSGDPCVLHERASHALDNLQKESPGIIRNESLWKDIYSMDLSPDTARGLYKQVAEKLPRYDGYWRKLAKAMQTWIELF